MKVFVDMDGVLADFDSLRDIERTENNPWPHSRVGFFYDLQPIDWAVSTVKHLDKKHEVYFLTKPSTRNPHCWTEKALWIEKHFGYEWTKKIIMTQRKDLLALHHDAILIDDNNEGAGQEVFLQQGKLIHFGKDGIDWLTILDKLG